MANMSKFSPDGGTTVYDIKDKKCREKIANEESNSEFVNAYSIGDLFWHNDILYKATIEISIGDTIIPGTNCSPTIISDELISVDVQNNGIASDSSTRKQEIIIDEEVHVIDGSCYMQASGNTVQGITSFTFTLADHDFRNDVIDIYADVYGVVPASVEPSEGQLIVNFLSGYGVSTVRIYIK